MSIWALCLTAAFAQDAAPQAATEPMAEAPVAPDEAATEPAVAQDDAVEEAASQAVDVAAQAGDATADTPAEDATSDKENWDLLAELGGTYVTGNARFFTIASAVKAGYTWKERNAITAEAGTVLSQAVTDANADGTLDATERAVGYAWTSQRAYGSIRYDRVVGAESKGAFYGLFKGEHDRFAGLAYRLTQELGYNNILVDNDKTKLRTEYGVAFIEEQGANGAVPPDTFYVAAVVKADFSHNISESVQISDTLVLTQNLFTGQDFRLNNTAAFTAKVSDNLSVKLSHILQFDNGPVAGFQKVDSTTMASLVASIF